MGFEIALWVARVLVEQELERRAQVPTPWPTCPHCGRRLRSKGFRTRQLTTWLGPIRWRRRVGRCPSHCAGAQVTPLDEALGVAPYQHVSVEVERLGCLLSLFLPFDLAADLMRQMSGLSVSSSSLWQWVQRRGQQAVEQLEDQLNRLAAQEPLSPDVLEDAVAQMTLVMAADGVMVPIRPRVGTPRGKTRWLEVKVAVLARLGRRVTRSGRTVSQLYHRRLVAVLGSIDDLAPRLKLEALRHGLLSAPKVVWLSDGGKGFWRLYRQYFAPHAVAVLDFYHAASHLWRAAAAWLDGRTSLAHWCFQRWRHLLRHGGESQLLSELTRLMHQDDLTASTRKTLIQVQQYLQDHRAHIRYQDYAQQELPLGSGIVESACKWLIQQRFKGVGMRWSEPGLTHLLHLRLAWVNQRFDDLFPKHTAMPNLYSPDP